jgi:hypothetical protein
VPICLAIAFVLADSRTASATCFENLMDCYRRAALRDSWWERSIDGVLCEFDFLDCARREIVGR